MKRLLITLLVLPLVSCTASKDASGTPADASSSPTTVGREAIASELADLFSRTSPESGTAAACFGDALATERTVDELREAGVLDEAYRGAATLPPLDRTTAGSWVDAWFGCIDFTETVVAAQQKVTKTLDPAGFEACFRETVGDDEIRAAATDGLSGDTGSDAVRRLSRAQFDCAEKNK